MARRVCRLENREAETFAQLSDGHVPDGMAFAADGRAFVCRARTTSPSARMGASGSPTPAPRATTAVPSASPGASLLAWGHSGAASSASGRRGWHSEVRSRAASSASSSSAE